MAVHTKFQSPSGKHDDKYKNHSYLVFFCIWLLLLHLGGLFLFTRGFLLTRLVLNNKSQCSETLFWNNTNNQYLYPWKKTTAEHDPVTTFDSGC